MTKRSLWIFFISLSLLLHLSGYWLSLSIPQDAPQPLTQKQVIEVEIREPKETAIKDAPLIRFAEAPKELIDDSLDALRKKADLLSERVQRVKKEMRAKLFGLTKNRPNPSTKPMNSQNKLQPFENPPTTQANHGEGFVVKKIEKPSFQESNSVDLAPSMIGQRVSDQIQVGNFTALNTDRHLYYSFYARIEEMIRPSWEDKVTESLRFLDRTTQLRPKGGWTTRIDVHLNSQGKLIKVVLLKGAGIDNFDAAAIEAFQKAGFFPHPPKEMVNEDGYILLKYLFTVY